MKHFLLLASILVAVTDSQYIPTQAQYNNNAIPPPAYQNYDNPMTGPNRPPLNYKQSMAQAKDQIMHILAKDRPVTESITNIQDYYEGIQEKGMKDLHPRFVLRRPKCKILPDPEPGLVNPSLIEPTVTYHPYQRDEEFVGAFAPPMKLNNQQLAAELNNGPAGVNVVGGPYQGVNNPTGVNGPNNPPGIGRPGIGRPGVAGPVVNNGPYPNNPVGPYNNLGPVNALYQPINNNNNPGPYPQPQPQQVVQVPMFLTQRETVYTGAGPTRTRDPNDFDGPTGTKTSGWADWFSATTRATDSLDQSALFSSLQALQSSMSMQSRSLSSVSAEAYFSSIAASLSSREASLSARATVTQRNRNYDDY